MSGDLAWRVEEACLNAWPAARAMIIDGWLLRASGGASRRPNSVNPLRFGPFDPRPVLPELLEFYAAVGQPILFRVPSIVPGMASALDAVGFTTIEGETGTLHTELDGWRGRSAGDVELTEVPSAEWLAARTDAGGADQAYCETLGRIIRPARFAAWRADGRIVSVACGAIRRGLLVFESVATLPEARGQGCAHRMLAGLMVWAAEQGVREACLQVAADNTPAVRLYRSLGFTRELYGYHYRRGRAAN